MKLARTGMISNIDAYLEERLGISTTLLMQKAGEAVAGVVRERVGAGKKIVILAGGGNNGGDGYATAISLLGDYEIKIFDVFSKGQKNECGKFFLEKCREAGVKIECLTLSDLQKAEIKGSDCIIDAVFGTGMHGEAPEKLRELAIVVRECVGAFKIAIDVPIGIDADTGRVQDFAVTVGATVELSYIKPGIISYPAKSYAGEIVYADLDIPKDRVEASFDFKYHYIDRELAMKLLPKREANSNKGTFGKTALITGSKLFRGAGQLTLSSALRTGAGYVSYIGESEECDRLISIYPEAIYKKVKPTEEMTDSELDEVVKYTEGVSSLLIGSGSRSTEGLLKLVKKLLTKEGAPIILDADAINTLSEHSDNPLELLRSAKRQVILTPHPLEFARLWGVSVSEVQANRIELAEALAEKTGAIVVLKGGATVITDGEVVYINSSGSSALAKAGSGDVLAGVIASLLASMKNPLTASALGVYLHGLAGDRCAELYSSFGVTPSDLPAKIAEEIRALEKEIN